MNFLEQLVDEWYAYQGYFVRTNIKYGKRKEGGYKGEIDPMKTVIPEGYPLLRAIQFAVGFEGKWKKERK